MMSRILISLVLLSSLGTTVRAELAVGFATTDVTPEVGGDRPVWLAGFGHGREATGVHDPLKVRAVVFHDGRRKIAFVGVDSIGLQLPTVERIRKQLSGFEFVLVASTHVHHAPDVIGIWGATPFKNGVDPRYVDLVVARVVEAVTNADDGRKPAVATFGKLAAPKLLRDSRLPLVFDDVLRVVALREPATNEVSGIVVQWNCHPEVLGRRNTEVTADFVASTVAALEDRYRAPVVFLSGAVGGLMAPPGGLYDAEGSAAPPPGSFAYAERYGRDVADVTIRAVEDSAPIGLTPLLAFPRRAYVPVDNPIYRLAQTIGTIPRDALAWSGDFGTPGGGLVGEAKKGRAALETEIAYLRLGEMHVACIPGELYPELVYGKLQEPIDSGADFPDAPVEPSVASLMPADRWLCIGLANDEIGYLIPKRQWDEKPPFCYGRKEMQYGEINSCSAEAAPIVMESLRRCVKDAEAR
jgi:hypothetical protein